MGKVRKDRRFWLLVDMVNGSFGTYKGYEETSTDPNVEGRGIRFKFIPIKDVNSVFQVFPATVSNWLSQFFEVFDKEPSVKELNYVTLWDNTRTVTPNNSHLPGVPEKIIFVDADQHGRSKYNRNNNLQEKIHKLEQDKKELEQKLDAYDIELTEAEQEAERDSSDGRKQRREDRPVDYNANDLNQYNTEEY